MNYHGGNIYGYQGRVVDFSSNINPLGPPESFKKALTLSMDEFSIYPEIAYHALKKDVAAYLGTEPERIIPGNGSVDLIFRSIKAAQRERVYGLAPTFSEYRHGAQLQNMDYIPLDAFIEDYSRFDLLKIVDLVRPDSTVVLCNPNNPTGTLAKGETVAFLAVALARKNCFLIVDEAFIEFTENVSENTFLPYVEKFPDTLVIRAATKFFGMPGIRLGYGVTSQPRFLTIMEELAHPWQINSAAVIAARVIFKDQEYIEASRDWIHWERAFCFGKLAKISGIKVYPSGANFHLIKIVQKGWNAYHLQEQLVKKGILIRTPQGFDHLTSDYFRLAVKMRKDHELLLSGLAEVLGNQ